MRVNFFKKGRRKWIALLMAVVMIFTAINLDSFKKKSKAKEVETATEYGEEGLLETLSELEYDEEEIVELEDEKTADSTAYSLGNGLKKVVYHSDDVRYKSNNGEWVDYEKAPEPNITRGGGNVTDQSRITTTSYSNVDFKQNSNCAKETKICKVGWYDGTTGVPNHGEVTYVDFTKLLSELKLDGKSIASANLILTETKDSTPKEIYGIYKGSGLIDYCDGPKESDEIVRLMNTGEEKSTKIDITHHIRDLVKNKPTHQGVLIKYIAGPPNKLCLFHGSDSDNIQARPALEIVYYDKPTAPSYYVTQKYIKKGEKVTVSWDGIVSQALDQVQYRISLYDLAADKEQKLCIGYSDGTKVGTTSSGTSTIEVSKDWIEGDFKLFLRGIDKYGNVGDELGIPLIIDGTKPTLGDVKLIGESSEQKYATTLPTIEWSGANDLHLKGIECSVDNNNWELINEGASGKIELPKALMNGAGKHNIKIRAIDMSGNVSDAKEFTYYYDGIAPTINSAITIPSEVGSTATPVVAWNIEDNTTIKVQCSVDGRDFIDISDKNIGSYTLKDGLIIKEGAHTIKLRAIDKYGNVSDKEISYTYSTGASSDKDVAIIPSGSDATYVSKEPTIVLSNVKDKSKVKMSYRLALNGDVVKEETIEADVIEGSAHKTINKELFKKSGDYSLEIKILDDNNKAIDEIKTTYKFDGVAPEVKDARIVTDDNKSVVNISGMSDDLSGIGEEVLYAIVPSYVADKDVKELDINAKASINDKKATFELTNEDTALADGIYKVVFAIKDKAGNLSERKSVAYFEFKNAKFSGEQTLEAKYNKDLDNIDITWTDNKDIKEAKLYTRLGDGDFKYENVVRGTNIISTKASNIQTTADYRVLLTYNDGKKQLSDIVSMTKNEEEKSDSKDAKEEKEKYEATEVDADEDGLADGYEIWDLSSSIKSKDTDGDGFDDRYEVTTLGTSPALYTEDADSDGDGLYNIKEYGTGSDPYLKDSDFDGISDAQDKDPVKTDIKSGKDVEYTQEIYQGVYDNKVETEEKDGTKTVTIQNLYTGKVKQLNVDGDVTSYYYDSKDNNIAVIGKANGEHVVNTYAFDKDNNMTYLTHNGFGYEFNYDNEGNISDIVAANRTLVSYKYNKSSKEKDGKKEDLLASTSYGNNFKYDYEYDSNDNVKAIKIDNDVAFEMSYDDKNNMTKQVDKVNGITYDYVYDNAGNIKSIAGSDGFKVSYVSKKIETMNDNGVETNTSEYGVGYIDGDKTRICNTTSKEHVSDKVTQTNTLLIDKNTVEYVVNENNKTETKSIKNKNGSNIVYTVNVKNDDGSQELRNMTGDNLKYTYDANDNITSITSSSGAKLSYVYDELEQLVRDNDSKAGTTTLYSYDKGGNITSKKVYNYTEGEVSGEAVSQKTYEYSDGDWRDLLTSYDGQAITYDKIGNPLQYRDGYNFTWTNGRSLKTVKKGDLSTSYKYNKDGIRTEKTVNGKKTKYQLEGNNIVKEVSEGKTIWYIYDGDGELIGFELNDKSYYYEKNLQGDITGIIDDKGVKVVTYRYDAWGKLLSMDGDKELGKLNPFRYRSYYYDEEIGMYYLQSRYYDAEIGRFINADDVNLIPTMQTGIKGTNLFEYCDDNPVNKEDQTGYAPSKNSNLKYIIGGFVGAFAKSLFDWLVGKAYDKIWAKLKSLVVKNIAPKIKKLLGRHFKRIAKMSIRSFKNIVNRVINGYKYIIKGLKWAWRFHKRAIVIAGFVTILVCTFVVTGTRCK